MDTRYDLPRDGESPTDARRDRDELGARRHASRLPGALDRLHYTVDHDDFETYRVDGKKRFRIVPARSR